MEVGLYGKLPSHGDFLRRRTSDAFVDRWDGWLQGCMAASRSALGERWLNVYLTSPAWRFVCASGTWRRAGPWRANSSPPGSRKIAGARLAGAETVRS